MLSSGSAASSFRAMVDLPAPDGEDNTNSTPRRLNPCGSSVESIGFAEDGMGANGGAMGQASSHARPDRDKSGLDKRWLIATGVIIIAAAAILLAVGRTPICTCGTIRLWEGAVNSPENSQQLSDWYSLSHFIHGLIFYGLTWTVLRRQPVGMRLAIAALIESGWELLENSPIIIDRYRAATIAVGYSGDSVLNSVSDIAFMTFGFLIARKLPWWGSVALALALELIALYAVRDNLTLNVWMLVAPSDAVRAWQAAG